MAGKDVILCFTTGAAFGGFCVLVLLCGLCYWGNVAALPKRLYVVVLAEVLGHHAKAGGAAIHGIPVW